VPPVELLDGERAPETDGQPAADAEIETETTDAGSDGTPKRKRSRRGTRGGRRRRKTPATNGAEAELVTTERVAVEEALEGGVEPEAPTYVPMSEWIDDFEARERRTG
jgi:hypothetical protein